MLMHAWPTLAVVLLPISIIRVSSCRCFSPPVDARSQLWPSMCFRAALFVLGCCGRVAVALLERSVLPFAVR